jgi:hypothetical protein
MSAIPYVQSAASQEVPPPYHFPGVTVNAFVCDANIGAVQRYCDRFFNLGDPAARGFTYRAAATWPYLLLLMIDYPVMIPATQGRENIGHETQYADRGVVSQKEVFFAVPVIRVGTAPGALITRSTLEWALPFIVVGNPMSAVCGREMLGLEKLRAEIVFGEGEYPNSFRGQVRLPGWGLLDPDRAQRMLPFLDLQTGPVIPTFRGSARPKSLGTLFRNPLFAQAISGLANLAGLVDMTTAGLMPMTMQTVSLKQFRDAAQPERALYQALISCRTKYSNISNFELYKEHDVQVRFHPQGSFGEIIEFVRASRDGAASDLPLGGRAVAAYRFNADIDFDDMRTLHTFPTDPGGGAPAAEEGDLVAPWLRPWAGFFGPRRAP